MKRSPRPVTTTGDGGSRALDRLAAVLAVVLLLPVAIALDRTYQRTAAQRCPDCDERVSAKARVCKHCGWRFAPRPIGRQDKSGARG